MKFFKLKKIIPILAAIIIIAAVWLVGFLQGSQWGWQMNLPSPFEKILNKEAPPDLGTGDMSIFWDTWKTILEKYVDRQNLTAQQMIEGATKGLVESLDDPYSEFLNSKENQALTEELSGEFFGIGMEISKKNNNIVIISPLPGTPAEKAGLQPNDIILKIDGKDATQLSSQEAANLIKGPKGTTVTLTIYRPNWNEAREITLQREKISVPTLTWQMLDSQIAYLRIYSFNQPLMFDFPQAAFQIISQHPKGLIIDLRNNPGGYLDAVTNISGWFLDKGSIILKEDFGDNNIKITRATGNGLLKDLPTVVLVNEGTASAAEILAGTLRDNRGVKLIGTQTFGKGSVQELVSLRDNNSLKITIAKWLTPNDTLIQGNGLKPDLEVQNNEELGSYSQLNLTQDQQLQAALAELKTN
ncbi:MAG: carboxyl-terminal processing protease [Patescibacteria group bacterium]|nr:carboxyl-terminal processing protease [Patescibacteria group bacterium]